MLESPLFSLLVIAGLLVALGIMRLWKVSMQSLVFGFTGAVIGLLLGALLSVPLGRLAEPYGSILPISVTLLLTVIAVSILLSRRHFIGEHVPFLRFAEKDKAAVSSPVGRDIFVDTSAIIDGRIADIARTGFVPGRLLVTRFVLAELQNIADSDDAMRRGRGRRGLEVLNMLREMDGVVVEVIEEDPTEIREVDAKLVALANKHKAHVLTTDFNLNRVAQIQGVRVLNVNELAGAIRPVVLPGEELCVKVVQSGKERGQGVGYLADGTMIVVENGEPLIGQDVVTEVTRVFQTVAGKMIFATIKKGQNGGNGTKKSQDVVAPPAPEEAPDANATEEAPEVTSVLPSDAGKNGRRRNGFKKNKGQKNSSVPRSVEDRLMQTLDKSQGAEA